MTSMKHFLSELHAEVSRLESVKLQLEQELRALPTRPLSVTTDTENIEEQKNAPLLRQKCKELKATIELFSAQKHNSLPESEAVRCQLLEESYRRNQEQLKECLGFLNFTRTEISSDINREEKVNAELQSLIQVAETKLDKMRQEEKSKSSVYKRLEAKCTKLDKKNKEIGAKMINFLKKHFPLPDHEMFVKVKSKMPMEATSERELQPLHEIVKELITLSLDHPNEPYLQLHKRHWPPFVEMLVKCDIALRHPADTNRIKLMPFQL